jgi:rod shape-determining protein MreC
MLKRPHYIILGVVILVTVVLLRLPSRTVSQIKLAISALFLPLYGASGSAQQLSQKAGNALVPRAELLRQLDQLQKENQLLKIQAAQWEEAARENARLRQSLGFPKQIPWKLKPARVVARDPANWWRTLKIDVGSRDGVTINSPVLSSEGYLVGRVAEAGYAHCQVVLVGDPACRVAVLIEDEKIRENGVIAPSSSSPLDNTLVDLSFLSRSSQLKAGQRVSTSGLGGIFPKGIRVGQIVDFRPIDFGLYNEARVKLEVNMNTLEEVWVILP